MGPRSVLLTRIQRKQGLYIDREAHFEWCYHHQWLAAWNKAQENRNVLKIYWYTANYFSIRKKLKPFHQRLLAGHIWKKKIPESGRYQMRDLCIFQPVSGFGPTSGPIRQFNLAQPQNEHRCYFTTTTVYQYWQKYILTFITKLELYIDIRYI